MKTIRSIILACLFIAAGGAVSGVLAFFGQPMLMEGGANAPPPPPPATVACDFGPNTTFPTGKTGTDLTAAGFTHCALNANFMDNSGATVGGGWIMTSPSTYIDTCKGTSTWGLLWFHWIGNTSIFGDSGAAPCNRLAITSDGAGSQVLQYTFNPSDIQGPFTSPTSGHIGFGLYWPICATGTCQALSSPGGNVALPTQHYYEITYEIAAGITQSTNIDIVSTEASSFHLSGNAFFDYAFLEAPPNSNPAATSMDNFTTASCPGFSNGVNKCSLGFAQVPDFANYHTWAYLTTSDGSTGEDACFYYDNGLPRSMSSITLQGAYCGAFQGVQAADLQTDVTTYHFIGDFDSFNNPPNTSNRSAPVTINIKSIRVFTCNAYQTGSCFGTMVLH